MGRRRLWRYGESDSGRWAISSYSTERFLGAVIVNGGRTGQLRDGGSGEAEADLNFTEGLGLHSPKGEELAPERFRLLAEASERGAAISFLPVHAALRSLDGDTSFSGERGSGKQRCLTHGLPCGDPGITLLASRDFLPDASGKKPAITVHQIFRFPLFLFSAPSGAFPSGSRSRRK